jgi:hypothetical protein
MSSYGDPLKGRQRTKEVKEEVIKPEKRVLTPPVCRELLDYKGAVGDVIIRWTERWLVQLVRERSYPPQIAGCEALASLASYLTPSDALSVLESIRRDFRHQHPILFPKEDFAFLLKAFADEGIPLSSLDHSHPLDERLRHILGL